MRASMSSCPRSGCSSLPTTPRPVASLRALPPGWPPRRGRLAGRSGGRAHTCALLAGTGAVRAVAAGDAVLAPAVTRRLLDQVGRRLPAAVSRTPDELAQLTDREQQVLRMLAAGLTNAEISEALVLSEATVKTHVSHLLGKLGLRDRVQAVIYAYETGLIQPSDR